MSDDFKVEIDEFALAKAIERFSAADLETIVLRGMQRGVNRIWEKLPNYPPPPPNSTYKRTGNLGRANYAKADIQGGEVIGRVGNKMKYAPWVIGGDDTQAKVHQGRWWQMPNQVEEGLGDVAEAINEEIGKALGAE